MRVHVLNDVALLKRAGQFAWLSIDTENPVNAAFAAKFPTGSVPTFLVIDPSSEKVTLAWHGTATAAQFGMLMDGAVRAAPASSRADAVLALADHTNALSDYHKAADYYIEALDLGGMDWRKRPLVLESLVRAYALSDNKHACTETALKNAPSMARDRSFVNVLRFGLDCSTPGTSEAHDVEKLAEQAVRTPDVFSDDISQLYESLAYSYRQEKNEADAVRVTKARIEYLQRMLARAKSPEARIALDFEYVSAANFLGKPELPVANLERDERELPKDYNPPYLLAIQLHKMKHYDAALVECDRAVHLAYGGARVRAYLLKGQILESNGDKVAAKKTYEEGLAYAKTLPTGTAKVAQKRFEAELSKM